MVPRPCLPPHIPLYTKIAVCLLSAWPICIIGLDLRPAGRFDTDIIDCIGLAPDVSVSTGVGTVVTMISERATSYDLDVGKAATGVEVDNAYSYTGGRV
jgi:hypothetical protein